MDPKRDAHRFRSLQENFVPQSKITVETPLYLHKVNVIGSYFFKTEAENNIKVIEEHYKAMISDFFVPEFDGCLCGRPLVPRRRRYIPYNQGNDQFI